MRLAMPLLALFLVTPAQAQDTPKPDPFVFEMPKKTDAEKPPKPAVTAPPKDAAGPATPPATPPAAPPVAPAAPARRSAATSPVAAATASPAAPSQKAVAPSDPFDFRLPNQAHAPDRKTEPKKPNPFAFELPQQRSDSAPKG